MIIEGPLLGQVQLEVTPSDTTFTWTDLTDNLVDGQFSSGGRLSVPGAPIVDAGNFTITLRDIATVPAIGSYVRLRRHGTTDYIWTGFIQDVSQIVQFDPTTPLTEPFVLTTLICLDWVGLASQFHVNGVTGKTSAGAVASVPYTSDKRVHALNYSIDNTMGTTFVSHVGTASGSITHTDFEASISEHLDLLSNSTGGYWYAKNAIPTNNTTGRDNLVEFRASGTDSTGITFTDELGSAGELHYTDILIESASSNVTNSINVLNRSALLVEDIDVTTIGGTYRSKQFATYTTTYSTTLVDGLIVDNAVKVDDATSIDAYGERYADVATNIALIPTLHGGVPDYNLVSNPNSEYDDLVWTAPASEATINRKKPMDETVDPFAAYDGEWAMRLRAKTTVGVLNCQFRGAESDGTPVKRGSQYRFDVYVARQSDVPTNAQGRCAIQWRDDDESTISTTYGSYVTLTNDSQWYKLTAYGTAPTSAIRATLRIEFDRTSGSFGNGDKLWIDALSFYRVPNSSSTMPYFTGDTADTDQYLYYWTGDTGSSVSARVTNSVKTRGDAILAETASTDLTVSRIRWNAQEDLDSAAALTVGRTIDITYGGNTDTYRIIGIDGSLQPERFVLDYYVKKVA